MFRRAVAFDLCFWFLLARQIARLCYFGINQNPVGALAIGIAVREPQDVGVVVVVLEARGPSLRQILWQKIYFMAVMVLCFTRLAAPNV